MAEDPRTLHVHQAMTYRATFAWQTNTATPVPISLAAYRVTFEILGRAGKRPALVAADSAEAFTVENGGVEIEPGGETGVARVTLTAAQTATLKRDGVYVLFAQPSSGDEPVEYVASGPVDLILLGE